MPPARQRLLLVLLFAAAAASTLSATAGLLLPHRLFKPLAMLIAIAFVASSAYSMASDGTPGKKFKPWLLAALVASLAGDVALMFPGYFIPGLLAFLLAHLAYLGLFHQGLPWFPRRAALAATLSIGAFMYAVLWVGGLPAGLRAPVAAYVVVIALMAAQAIGRALLRRDADAWGVACGAGCFMLSDALLALNKFVMPLPLAPLWVLGSYYAAQILIVRHARPG